MKILTNDAQNYIVDSLGFIKVALMDMGNEPVQTAAMVNGIVNSLVQVIGGQKGIERCNERVSYLLDRFDKMGISEGLPCDKKT